MLSIKPIGSSTQEVSYYSGLGKEDYYLAGSEPPGTWWGTGASSLGLVGKVDSAPFRRILRGYSKDASTALVQNAGDKKRRAAFDLTFSAPKSVSALWSQVGFKKRKLIEAACTKALYKTLDEFQSLCGVTRRGKQGISVEQAGLVAAIFRHETARGIPGHVPDPNLHFHVVLANVVARRDGSTGAFDARALFSPNMKMALGALFRAELSKELGLLGLESFRPKRPNGKLASWFELQVVPVGLIAEFSKRRLEIEKWLRKKGLRGAKAAERAALATRTKKESITRKMRFFAWQETGQKHGLSEVSLEDTFLKKLPKRYENATDVVSSAIKRITAERAHFSRLELLRFSAEEAQGKCIGIAEIKEAVDFALMKSKEIVRLKQSDGQTQFTTKEMLFIEKRMLEAAGKLKGKKAHFVDTDLLARILSKHATIRPEQAEAVRHIVLDTGGIACVNGMAGTGKTYTLNVARKCFERAGYQVVGTALAATAAKQLENGAGIKSVHIHKIFFELENGYRKLSNTTVLFVDEAGMIGTHQLERLTALALDKGIKLVLVGDAKQLQAIDAGSPFRGISERVGVCKLRDIIRQQVAWQRQAVKEFSKGKAECALKRFSDNGMLHILSDPDKAIEKLVLDWEKERKRFLEAETLIFAGTNLEVSTLNRLCQQKRLDAGELGGAPLQVGTEEFYVGDRVLFSKNNAGLLIRNGTVGTVVSITPETDILRVKVDDGYTVSVNTRMYEHLKLGYAVTTHKGQGQTVKCAFMLAGGAMTDRELTYVQASRARVKTQIYADILTGGEDIQMLSKQMNRSRAKALAHDYVMERKWA